MASIADSGAACVPFVGLWDYEFCKNFQFLGSASVRLCQNKTKDIMLKYYFCKSSPI